MAGGLALRVKHRTFVCDVCGEDRPSNRKRYTRDGDGNRIVACRGCARSTR